MSHTEHFKIVDGFIVSPGKFEGEPEWILKLYEMVMDGRADESVHDGSMVIDAFRLDASMARLTGLDAQPDHYVCIWSDDAGFVSHKVMSETQLFECEGMIPHENFDDYPVYESGY